MKTVSSPPNFDQLVDEDSQATFTSRKLDLINALLVDPRLIPSDFKVAVVLVQFMNSETGMIFPTLETIADIVHMSTRNVEKCLVRLRQAGWLVWKRGNRQMPNVYEFDTKNVRAMLDYRTSIDDGRRERAALRRSRRSDRNGGSPQISPKGTTVPVATRTTVPVQTGTTVPSNTYMEHLNGTPEEEIAIEGEPLDSQYAATGKWVKK